MKNLIRLAIPTLVIISAPVLAQPTTAPKAPPTAPSQVAAETSPTKLQSFLSKKGTIIIRDFYRPEKIESKEANGITNYWVTVTALTVYEPGKEAAKIKGIQCELVDFGRRTADSNMSFLDLDEAQSLSKGLVYLIDLASKWKTTDVGSKEVYFSTKDDFKVGFSKDKDEDGAEEIKAFISSGRIGATTIEFSSVGDLTRLKASIDDGIKWLTDPTPKPNDVKAKTEDQKVTDL